MLNLIKAGFIWCGMLLSFCCFGQYYQLPLGSLPMQFNGSFAGETSDPRISSNFGYGKRKSDQQYTFFTSYDQFIPAIRSGIGISAGVEGSSMFLGKGNGSHFSLAVAPKISIKGKYTLSPSLDVTYIPQASSITLMGYNPIYPNYSVKGTTVQSRAGLLFNTSKYYIGYSVYLIDHYKFHYDYVSPTPDNIVSGRRKGFVSHLQLGYTFQRSAESKFAFTPQVVFRIAENLDPFQKKIEVNFFEAYNFTFKYGQFIWGINNTGLHLGLQTDRIKLMVSNKLNLGIFGDNLTHPGNILPYSTNLSFRYVFKK